MEEKEIKDIIKTLKWKIYQLQQELIEKHSETCKVDEFEKLILKAQRRLWRDERKWLVTNLECYNDSTYEVRLYVLEGSPPRGYILADKYSGIVKCWDSNMTRPYTIRKRLID